MARSWYVIRTKPQCEYIAAAALEREGFDMFFPRVNTPLPRAGHGDVPLFPGYLFLRYDLEKQDWPSVRRLPGILGYVRFGGVAPPVPDELITQLIRRVGAINGGGGLWKRFQKGDKVHVVSGRMESLAEVVEAPRSPEARARVLLEFMGRLVPAQVFWHDMRPAREGSTSNENRQSIRRTRGRGRWIRGFGPRAVASV